jgi:hypothetical protein
VDRLTRSARPADRAVAAHYRSWRGGRLSETGWGGIGPNEASLFLAVESRILPAAREVLERYRTVTGSTGYSDDYRRSYAATLALLASRDFEEGAGPAPTARREQAIRTARDFFLTHWELPFEKALGRALREAGYSVTDPPGEQDLGELVRAARDRRWYLARNAVWMLGVLAPDGPRRFESVAGLRRELLPSAEPPSAGEIEAWETWWSAREGKR